MAADVVLCAASLHQEAIALTTIRHHTAVQNQATTTVAVPEVIIAHAAAVLAVAPEVVAVSVAVAIAEVVSVVAAVTAAAEVAVVVVVDKYL